MNSSTGNEVQSSVFECIKSGTEDAGVSIDKICSVLKDRFKENDIRFIVYARKSFDDLMGFFSGVL